MQNLAVVNNNINTINKKARQMINEYKDLLLPVSLTMNTDLIQDTL